MTIAVSATNDDSSRKHAWTVCRRNPMARRTPICWRRSTTERAQTTPSAATPTIRPRPMKPSISRSNVRLADTASARTFLTASACMPLARNADSSVLAVLTESAPGASAKRWTVGTARSPNAEAIVVCDVQRPVIVSGERSESTPMTVRCALRPRLRIARIDADRGERLVLEVEAAEREVGHRAEVVVLLARRRPVRRPRPGSGSAGAHSRPRRTRCSPSPSRRTRRSCSGGRRSPRRARDRTPASPSCRPGVP